jgi:2-dehydro-3-deoxy-D-arabinonate dehydratase
MKLCRFRTSEGQAAIGLLTDESWVLDLSAAGVSQLTPLLESDELVDRLTQLARSGLPRHRLSEVRLLAPVEGQEVWAAGVTYLRSKKARMEESDFSATAYDRVYDAPRPELFFKALAEKVAGPGEPVGIRQDARWNVPEPPELFFKALAEKVAGPDEPVGIRQDARWNVPEPELALMINSRGQVAGYTIGNDMSSRDIEGENLLYLPQAKIYEWSCALGPCIRVGASEAEARTWTIMLEIRRAGTTVFEGHTSVANIKRTFGELVEYLYRSQSFPHGAVLLTGTGIVPPADFSLRPGDAIRIGISGLGTLENGVAEV